MWCDVWVWTSALQPHTHTISHSHTDTLTHSHTLLITCTCCYDQIKGAQDKDFSYSFSDSPSLSPSLLSLLTSLTHHTFLITCTCCYDDIKGTKDQEFSCSFSDSPYFPSAPSLSAHRLCVRCICSRRAQIQEFILSLRAAVHRYCGTKHRRHR